MTRPATAPARREPITRPKPRRSPRRPAAPPLPRGAAVLDAILHGRAWIGLVFVLLAGIVFFNVDLLQMNRQIAQTEERVGTLKRENAQLRADLARLGSSERIQRVAAERGLVLPAPGEVRYLRADPAVDARRAARRLEDGEGKRPGGAPGAAAGAPAEAAVRQPPISSGDAPAAPAATGAPGPAAPAATGAPAAAAPATQPQG